jgi:DNA-binding GntR family transcriptional regulator
LDFDAFASLDAEFNQLCLEACCNSIAASMMRMIGTRSQRFWYMHHGRVLAAEGVESHIQIARALANANAEAAVVGVQRLLNYLEGLARRALTQLVGPEGRSNRVA